MYENREKIWQEAVFFHDFPFGGFPNFPDKN